MSDIRAKLDHLLEKVNSGSYGRLYGRKETADERLKIVYAQLRDEAPDGTAPDKDAWVRRQPRYIQEVEEKANAYADWKTAEAYVKLAFTDFDIWRSEEATHRGLDRRSGG